MWAIRMALLLTLSFSTFAMPNKIILIRHADKLIQFNPGPALSSEGMARANNFARYYLQKFKITPDFIISVDPTSICKKPICPVDSIRPLQTVAPLITEIYCNNPQTKHHLLLAPYARTEIAKLATMLRSQNFINNKFVLICLGHSHIPLFLQLLTAGYKLNTPLPTTWSRDDFSSVLILEIDNDNKSIKVEFLHQQY